MKKRVFYTEVAYGLSLILLALGTAMTAQGGFGMSMVVAPAYILHLKLSRIFSWFGFGMAEYLLQILILALMMLLLKKGKAVYLLAIPAAVIYGVLLDGAMGLLGQLSPMGFWGRLGLYSLGVLVCTASLSLLFHSYLPPAAYEMLVKTLAARYKWKLIYVKTVYDLCSLGISVALSLLLLGSVQGIGAGTVVCALIYGWMIGLFGKLFGKYWQFRDRFALRSVFEESEEII